MVRYDKIQFREPEISTYSLITPREIQLQMNTRLPIFVFANPSTDPVVNVVPCFAQMYADVYFNLQTGRHSEQRSYAPFNEWDDFLQLAGYNFLQRTALKRRINQETRKRFCSLDLELIGHEIMESLQLERLSIPLLLRRNELADKIEEEKIFQLILV
ncbi:MAG: hypothetical protein ABIJ18_02520 [archaeon]